MDITMIKLILQGGTDQMHTILIYKYHRRE